MITEDYCSYEIAKLLKEKGMEVSCFNHYVQKNNNNGTSEAVTVCTLQMAMKWLREVHNIHIDIFVTYKDGIPHYQWSVDNLKTQDTISETPCCNAYEEAVESAIKYCLENLI